MLLHGRRRYGVEFTYRDAPRMTKSLHIALGDLGIDRAWIVYPGQESYPVHERLDVVSIRDSRDDVDPGDRHQPTEEVTMIRQELIAPASALALVLVALAAGPNASPRTPAAVGRPDGALAVRADGLTYPIVDTGQTWCYDVARQIPCPARGQPFYGQDAQHAGGGPSYLDNGDGTVTDVVTGLVWQRSPGDKVTFAQAVEGAATLDLGGHRDWRLPSIKELYSLIVFSGVDPSGWNGSDTSSLVPFIDTGFFDFEYGDVSGGERIIDAQYWSGTEYVSTTMGRDPTVFGVNFADGRIKGYPRDRGPRGTPMREFVRYVRGNPVYGANDLADNGDGAVTDRATGLEWMQADSGTGMAWRDALAWVAARNADRALGHDDWRLPNAKELQSIADYTRSPATSRSAAIDPVFGVTEIRDEGGGTDYPFYWTSTTHVNMSQQPGGWAAYVCFGEALGWMQGPSGAFELLDVHGAGAQRSDPKAGDVSRWPHGNGPQGDVVRILNYVRPVRDAAAGVPTSMPTLVATATEVASRTATTADPATPTASATPAPSATATASTTATVSTPSTPTSPDLTATSTASAPPLDVASVFLPAVSRRDSDRVGTDAARRHWSRGFGRTHDPR